MSTTRKVNQNEMKMILESNSQLSPVIIETPRNMFEREQRKNQQRSEYLYHFEAIKYSNLKNQEIIYQLWTHRGNAIKSWSDLNRAVNTLKQEFSLAELSIKLYTFKT